MTDQLSPGSPKPIVVRLMSQKGHIDKQDLVRYMPGGTLDQSDVVFTTSDTDDADVVVVINYLKYDTSITARKGYIWNWHNEPIVRRPFARGYDRIYTHVTTSGDPRVHNAPPVLNWWVGKTFDELASLRQPRKTKTLSAIASTKTQIEGHRLRNQLIARIESDFPDIDVFGHGRARQLDDKWSGIAPYRYSIAIENSSLPHYWTEKIADCFLSYTVPVYFGATNIGDYFPEESYVWLPLNDIDQSIATIAAVLDNDDWEARLPALHQARELMLNEYSLYGQIRRRVLAERDAIESAPVVTTKVHGRRTRRGGWIRGQGVTGNLKALLHKRQARRAN